MLLGAALKEIDLKESFVSLRTSVIDEIGMPKLILFPGLDGTPTAIEGLASNLNSPAICIQYNSIDPKDTIEDMALEYLPVRKKK